MNLIRVDRYFRQSGTEMLIKFDMLERQLICNYLQRALNYLVYVRLMFLGNRLPGKVEQTLDNLPASDCFPNDDSEALL